MSALSSLSLEDRLVKHAVPYNQHNALSENVSASKIKNKKGRIYSENWSLLCMLLVYYIYGLLVDITFY